MEHADAAFAASWRESQSTAEESWTQPPQAEHHTGSQTEASLRIDKAIHDRLVSASPSHRERQRLTRLLAEHAGAWVTAVPSSLDGSDCCMSPAVFRVAVLYRLGMSVARPDVVCPFCMQSFDECGDHAACCKMNGDLVVRHNRLRNLLSRIADEGQLSPVLEKKGILRDEFSGRRPGDVTIANWKDSKGLAIDVAVTSSFSKRNLRLPTPADTYGLKKHTKYDEGFVGSGHIFCAVVFETMGGVSEEGLTFFRQLFRFAARRQNRKLCVYAGRAWARISCNLQSSVAKAILNRVPTGGQPQHRAEDKVRLPVEPNSKELWEDAEGGAEEEEKSTALVPVDLPLSSSLSPSPSPLTVSTLTPTRAPRFHSSLSPLSPSFSPPPSKTVWNPSWYTLPSASLSGMSDRLAPKTPDQWRLEEVSLPLRCEFHIGPRPNCPDCVTGVLICSVHLITCSGRGASSCPFCKRVLCLSHSACFCTESELEREEEKTNRNLLLVSFSLSSHSLSSFSPSLSAFSRSSCTSSLISLISLICFSFSSLLSTLPSLLLLFSRFFFSCPSFPLQTFLLFSLFILVPCVLLYVRPHP